MAGNENQDPSTEADFTDEYDADDSVLDLIENDTETPDVSEPAPYPDAPGEDSDDGGDTA
jgi:hypothetical protein